ncbi:DUF4123 domain-containing protein [Cupriavidus cauae]|uniref:DUF4123 domain-containing protein n=1 Tax=Cupriavidus cauae TaxID=2608999 RepID=A0A5M8AWG6_9BURK|nr:DUF4123 domain-containing protein [Cupriavidus cauae]KAA6125194.1 DUF4123 domain-containing protein [Cupriavidus cauae]
MFDLHHRFLNGFTHVLLNPLQLGRDTVDALPAVPLAVRGIQPHLLPAVLPLVALGHTQKLDLVDQAIRWQHDYFKPYFSACLVSDATTPHVVSHLSSIAVVAGLASKQRFLLRFWDPRIFSQLLRILDDVQLDALMGPVDQWHWADLAGMCRCRMRGPHQHAPFRLRSEQFALLQRVGAVNACIAMLLRAGRHVDDPVILGGRVDAALVHAAEKTGLRDAEDCRLYAVQTVVTGMPAEAHPQFKHAVARAAKGECSYVGACAELTDQPLGAPAIASTDDRLWEQA